MAAGRPGTQYATGRPRRIKHDGPGLNSTVRRGTLGSAGQLPAGHARDLRVRAVSPPGALDAAPVPPGQDGRGHRGSGGAEAELENRAAVHPGGARPASHRTAHHLREPRPARDRRPDQEQQGHCQACQRAGHRGQPGGQPQPGADPARGQRRQQRRRGPGHDNRKGEYQQRRPHVGLPAPPWPASRRTTARSTSDSSPSICATKWLSTASVSPPPASASRIRRALYSSRLAVGV